MPHSPEDKKRVITRLRRIKGQTEALERAVNAGSSCNDLLQQLAALRGATNGLMAEVLESHLRETFLAEDGAVKPSKLTPAEDIEQLMKIIRSYLK
ncbi:metal/formaldehyde-sensitive transcriptional repressor [Lampropedia puyangensis]|uniref:Metal/formaldehyde-sensitive transcriptional repressor n=1 Tax=Lampropedia puyangensis TaxID=1330072 RepID=A0A4S8F089_9BURK|nr:metal/formaldehyde-sensitive transcriptional repressor [Lampropedia puyangensis]THU00663.1 metal/formaldehyde-sensitive transcriptional repressor [Lampropedia puyangensis]